MNWISTDTFNALNVSSRKLFTEEEPFCPDWCNRKLDYDKHDLLYEYLLRGRFCLYRPNSQGEIEIILQIDDMNPLRLLNAKFIVSNIQKHQNIFGFDLFLVNQHKIIYTIPFVFNLNIELQKYCCAAVCEQKAVPLYLVRFERNKLYVLCCKQIKWPDEVREQMIETVLRDYP